MRFSLASRERSNLTISPDRKERIFLSPRLGTPGRGVGGEGLFERRSIWSYPICFALRSIQDRESQVHRAPHAQPLSPEYRGEGR